ncbi:MAG: glycosyltransferase family 4 protein [Planctomycetes bacterium]|nr:glycosyltransferase family 4 protein [Planctomycetota bacterium]
MHIAIVRRHCTLKKGGAERYCVNLFRGLQRLGHQVTIVGEAIDDELKDEVAFVPVPVLRLNSWTRNKSFFVNTGLVLKKHRFDVVHGLSRVDGLDTFRLTERLQKHWVNMYYRNPVTRWLQHWNPRHRVVFDLEQRIFGPGGVRRVIVQSRLDARLLREQFGVDDSRICQIINGVDTTIFHPGVRAERTAVRAEWKIDADVPLLAFASMDFRGKGLDTVIEALARLKHTETQLLVLGQGTATRFIRKARALGIERRVIFAGRQSAIQRFYGAADLFVLPTIYEPFPNVNLEAMACGTPVITTATAGGAEIIHEGANGYLIPDAWAVDILAERIDAHLSLPSSRKQSMHDACWDAAARLRIVDNAQKVAAMFAEVLQEKHAA